MSEARRLLPYLVAALVVVAGSLVALGLAVADLRDARQAAVDRADSSAAPTRRAFPELSDTGRLAYWRTNSERGGELLVSNLDGSMKRSLATHDELRRVSLTRWLPDGSGVAWVERGTTLVLVRLDGRRVELSLPDELSARSSRIAAHRWSPDGARVAASVVGVDLRGDVYTADIAQARWSRATDLDEVFVAEWLDDETVLVQTGGGVIGGLRYGALNAIRPLTGLPATSPIIADDGRIHFLVGSVSSTPRDMTLAYLTASNATVWSITADGSEPRQETFTPLSDIRLDSRYDDGRYLAHRVTSALQLVLGDGLDRPPTDAGAVERAVVAPDRRSAIGFASNRIVRFRLDPDAAFGNFGSPTVMLDSIRDGDVWHPRPALLPGPPGESVARPAAKYAFGFGGRLWTMDPDGVASFFRAGASGSGRRPALNPTWSPAGDALLTLELAGSGLAGVTAATPIAVTIDTDGRATRHVESRAATGTPTWSPDGSAFAVVVDGRGVDGASALAQLEARFLTRDGVAARPAIKAREAIWLRDGVLIVTDAAIELVRDDGRRAVIASLAPIVAQMELPADPSARAFALAAAPDVSFLALRITHVPRIGRPVSSVALLRGSDGLLLRVMEGRAVQDLAWSPAGPLLGYTFGTGNEADAILLDARTGVETAHSGRFAGWSPDGQWFYVARADGLFAHRVAGGGEPVRISPIGVPVSATAS